jgi:hypothetical protein
MKALSRPNRLRAALAKSFDLKTAAGEVAVAKTPHKRRGRAPASNAPIRCIGQNRSSGRAWNKKPNGATPGWMTLVGGQGRPEEGQISERLGTNQNPNTTPPLCGSARAGLRCLGHRGIERLLQAN